MKLVFNIARAELKMLFYSPISWLLIVVFLVYGGFIYGNMIERLINVQESMERTAPGWYGYTNLTRGVFISRNGVFPPILSNLFLFIPLLTMGIINKDHSGNTIKLLYSSSVKIRQIILGKFLSVFCFNILLTGIVLFFTILGYFSIENADPGYLFTGLLVFFVTIISYTAIGLFFSSITNYQLVAAIGTFLLLYFLSIIGSVWQDYDFIRELTYFLSIQGRSNRMLLGLITSRDIIYYILLCLMFLSFAYLSLKHEREKVSFLIKSYRYCKVVLVVLIVGFITSKPSNVLYWDLTRTQANTIAPVTQDIISAMKDAPVEVTLYSNLLGSLFDKSRPSQRNSYTYDFWEKYLRFNSNIKFKYVYYYDQMDGDSTLFKFMPDLTLDEIARETAKRKKIELTDKFLLPQEIRKIIDLDAEGMDAVMLLKYKNKSHYLRFFRDAKFYPDEEHVAAAFKRISTDTVPKVYYSTGHYERDIFKFGERNYYNHSLRKDYRNALINHGYEFDTINLNYNNIPSDASVFVLADPKVPLSDIVVFKLKHYIDQGGNLLLLGEPGKQNVVNPVLKHIGVELLDGTVMNVTKHEMPHMVNTEYKLEFTEIFKRYNTFSNGIKTTIQHGHDPIKILFPGIAPLSYVNSEFKVIKSSYDISKENKWVKTRDIVLDSAAPIFNASNGDYRLDTLNYSLLLFREKEGKSQKIAIVGDADHYSNIRPASHLYENNVLKWLIDETYPIELQGLPSLDTRFSISLKFAETQKFILQWIIPFIAVAVGSILLIRRKRK